jgi:hypothetical protein
VGAATPPRTGNDGAQLEQNGVDVKTTRVAIARTSAMTHRLHYTQYQEGFSVMRSGQSGKVILNWVD